MKSKLVLSLIVVILVSLIVSRTALAADEALWFDASTGLRDRFKYGEVTEIGIETFSIEVGDRGIYTYLVDENTRFRIRGVVEPGYSDLEIGTLVIVAAKVEGDKLVARLVAITPGDFNPTMWMGVRARGVVLEVDTEAGTLTVMKPNGEEIPFNICSRTRFIGAASSLEELEIGWFVGVAAGEQDDGSYTATVLVSAENRRRIRKTGLVTDVDQAAGIVTISTRSGDEVSFYVDEDTRFYSHENQIHGLSDLIVDMVAVIFSRYRTDGSYLATQIAAANSEDLPHYDVKAGGRIIEMNAEEFTILSQSGEEVTFNIDSDTNFRGRGVDVQSLADIEVGMVALAGGDSAENGDTVAKLIIIFQNSPDY